VPSSEALLSVLNVIEAKAHFDRHGYCAWPPERLNMRSTPVNDGIKGRNQELFTEARYLTTAAIRPMEAIIPGKAHSLANRDASRPKPAPWPPPVITHGRANRAAPRGHSSSSRLEESG
jgi:hypothetical protein